MASPEYTAPENLHGFQDRITYARPELRPAVVTRLTSNVLDSYFGRRTTEFAHSKFVLADTLRFIDNAREGLVKFPRIVDGMGLAGEIDLEHIGEIDRKEWVPPDEQQEALRFAMIAMGAMPKVAEVSYTDFENKVGVYKYSPRGIMAPPETIRETSERLREVRQVTFGVITGKVPTTLNMFGNQRELRARFFFYAGEKIATY